jgi:hypothetical protein
MLPDVLRGSSGSIRRSRLPRPAIGDFARPESTTPAGSRRPGSASLFVFSSARNASGSRKKSVTPITMVIPKLFEEKGADNEIRVWVTGCSTGEEAYSIAILLREHLEKLAAAPKVQIFATDIDENALGIARAARYPASVVKEVSPERLRRFFCARSRYLQGRQGVARYVHLLDPQRHPRSPILTARPHLLPEPADLFEARAAGPDCTALSLFTTAGGLPVSRYL